MTNLTISNLSKSFGAFAALSDVSIDIPHGKFVCLLGPSGCGKTTLLRLIAGLEQPNSGSIVVDGQDLTDIPAHRRQFGMVFQSLALFPHLNVADNIAYPLAIRGVPRVERRRRSDELLDLVRLKGYGDRSVHKLSGGQRQRVAIARGLAVNPRIFLLDEPLSALDVNLREHMQIELRQLQQQLGVTTIVVTHDQKEALTMSDIVIVLDQGKVQQIGPPLDLYRRPTNAFVASFIGTNNLLPCSVENGRELVVQGQRLLLSPEDRIDATPGDTAVLSVRPEDVLLRDAAPAGAIAATVTFVRALGESLQTTLRCGDRELTSTAVSHDRPAVSLGDTVGVAFRPGKCTVLRS